MQMGSNRDGKSRDGKSRDGKSRDGKKRGMPFRKKVCKLCREKIDKIDYKDLKLLERLITERGKVVSSRVSGNCSKHQHALSQAIKRARFLALLPFSR